MRGYGKVIARGTIHCPRAELDAMRPYIDEHVRLSLAEPGCIEFDIFPSGYDDELFHVREEFVDRDAFATHTARTRASQWWERSQHLPRDINVFDRPDKRDMAAWTPPPAPPADLVLSGRRVRLERRSTDHTTGLWAAFQADTSGRGWDYLPMGPYEDEAGFADYMAESADSPDPHYLTIIDQKTDQPLGFCSFMRITPEKGTIEVGAIHFSPQLQGTPSATEAMFLMADWAFSVGYRRYEWKCDAANLPSRRAAQRLGFSYEGIFRQAMVVKGLNRDTAWFGMTDIEWPSLKNAMMTWLSDDNFTSEGAQISALSNVTQPFRVDSDPAL